MTALLRGRFRTDEENPVNRLSQARVPAHRACSWCARRFVVVAIAVCSARHGARGAAARVGVHAAARRGVLAGDAHDVLRDLDRRGASRTPHQDRRHHGVPEVASVHGKAGRAETATDPAQLEMIETVIALHRRASGPSANARWWSGAPRLAGTCAASGLARPAAPHLEELARDMAVAIADAGLPDGRRPADPDPHRHAHDGCAHARGHQGLRRGPRGDRAPLVELEGMLARGAGHAEHVRREAERAPVHRRDHPIGRRSRGTGSPCARCNEVLEAAIGGMTVSTPSTGAPATR
jgi:hypothetical protein